MIVVVDLVQWVEIEATTSPHPIPLELDICDESARDTKKDDA